MSDFADSYSRAFDAASEPLRPIQQALADRGITLSIEQTGGWTMVGYVHRAIDGAEYPYFGISHEAGYDYMLCRYDYADDDGTIIGDYADLSGTVDKLTAAIGGGK